VPVRVNWAGVALSLAVAFTAVGCNATCIRDSDCLGQAMCSDNRCILLVRRDAGRTSPPDNGADDDFSGSDASSAAPDAGD
jgi:hypothetical protein